MARPLDLNEIKHLVTDKKSRRQSVDDILRINTDSDPRPDPLKRTPSGEKQPGDRTDIWTLWVKQGRTGAEDLIKKYAS